MDMPYALDRYVAILTRARACLGVLFGLGILALCLWALSGWRPSASPQSDSLTDERPAQVRPARDRSLEERRSAARGARTYRSLDRLQNSPGLLAYGFAAGAFFTGLSIFEFIIARRIRQGERRGLLTGAAIEGIGAMIGLVIFLRRPEAGIGVVASLVIFVYCIARLSGTGPKPV